MSEGVTIIGDIVEIITAGLVDYAKGFGEGLAEAVKAIFLQYSTGENPSFQGLSITGQVVVAFGALALAVGVTTLVFKWITSLGKRK